MPPACVMLFCLFSLFACILASTESMESPLCLLSTDGSLNRSSNLVSTEVLGTSPEFLFLKVADPSSAVPLPLFSAKQLSSEAIDKRETPSSSRYTVQ